MLRRSVRRPFGPLQPRSPDFKERRPTIKKEVGLWLYKEESLGKFQKFCKEKNVKARGTVKITSTDTFARCLRTMKPIYPGTALVTAPADATYNFLVAAKEMYATEHNFPLTISWNNWNKRFKHLNGSAMHEMICAGWMARTVGRRTSPWTTYIDWLLEDTTNRDGIASGISRERGDGNQALDQMFQDMANDAGEEINEHMEMLFRAYATVMKRALPLDVRLIEHQIRGSGIDKGVRPADLFVPTLIPLIDCVPQDETGKHNTMLDFHTTEELNRDRDLLNQMGLTLKDVSSDIIGDKGMFSLRAMEMLDEGSYLLVRGWPKTEQTDNEAIQGTIMEQTLQMNNLAAS